MNQGVLKRQVGLGGAVLLGLGSMVGTGLFVSTLLVVESAGAWAPWTVLLATVVALCNGLNSAQLAAAYPVAGGTYEYGYRLLSPAVGFAAGWFFLCAKSASAATAALALAAYGPRLLGVELPLVPTALGLVGLAVLLVLAGLRLTNAANFVLVSMTLVGVVWFAWAMLANAPSGPAAMAAGMGAPIAAGTPNGLFLGAALMFVAFTGYGRVATLGEEIVDPARNIPIAVLVTVVAAAILYLLVTWVLIQPWPARPHDDAAPLQELAATYGSPTVAHVTSIAALTAMTAVLLNLVLGLSRMVLALGRRQDLPSAFARLNARGTTPVAAVVLVGAVIAAITLVGNLRTTWTFSACTVLLYYSITNLSALRLPASQRRYPRLLGVLGLWSCLFLAVWIPPTIWATALAILATGFVLRATVHRPPRTNPS